VISALVHIGSELEEPWPFEVEDHDGVLHAINLQPGQVRSLSHLTLCIHPLLLLLV
jgi:hypothetical protein